MPNWTDESGFSWFGKLRCKRCNSVFEQNKKGEVPIHECLGGLYTSHFDGVEHHVPIRVLKDDKE